MARTGVKGRTIDLFVRFLDVDGNSIDTDDIPQVKITDSNGLVRQEFTNIGVSIADDPGLYKFEMIIDINGPDGIYTDTWKTTIGGDTVENDFTFTVTSAGTIQVDSEPVYEPGADVPFQFNKEEVNGINILLKIFKARIKNNGVSKVPDGYGGFITKPCPVFSDDDLVAFLVNGLSEFNQIPHFTHFHFSDPVIYGIFADVIIQGAVILALAAQSLIERGREFTITDNGITYQPPQISEILNNQYGQQLTDYKEKVKFIKCNLKPSPMGLGTFRVTSISPNFLRLRHLRERQLI